MKKLRNYSILVILMGFFFLFKHIQKLSHGRRDEYDSLGVKKTDKDIERGGKNQVTPPYLLKVEFNLA